MLSLHDSIVFLFFFFFFSSRRRHTRFDCDWSSDVCSSDLSHAAAVRLAHSTRRPAGHGGDPAAQRRHVVRRIVGRHKQRRSEEHTSELQSQSNLVCRLLLEKKKKPKAQHYAT